jgi:CheY-like chemotaxis protein
LRRATAHTVKANADVAQLVANGDLKILLVDDNDVNLIVARMLLHKCLPKATVIDVSSAALALEQLRRRSFDVVLMDVIMPEMTPKHIENMVPAEVQKQLQGASVLVRNFCVK